MTTPDSARPPARVGSKFARDPIINRSLHHSVRDGVSFSVMTGAGETYFSAYALFYKATSAQISVLAAFPALLGSVAQLVSAWLTQKMGRRRAIVLAGVGLQTASWLPLIWLPYLFPTEAVSMLIACVTLYYAGGHLAAPAWNSLMGDLVPENRRGRFFGMRTRLMSLTMFAALAGAGIVLHLFESGGRTRLGFTAIFLVATIARVYSFTQLIRMHEPTYVPHPFDLPTPAGFLARLYASDFARFALFFAFMNLAVAIASPFFTVLMLRDFGFSYLEFMVSTGVAIIAQFMSLRLWGRLSDAFGNCVVLRLTGSIVPIFPVLWLVSSNFWYILVLQLAGGATWAGFSLAAGNYLYDVVAREKRATYTAIHQTLGNGAIFLGALSGGFLTTVIPRTIDIFGSTMVWTSPLWGVLVLSTVTRVGVAAMFLPRLREVRDVRRLSTGSLIIRLIRINAITGLVSDLLAQRRTVPKAARLKIKEPRTKIKPTNR